MTIAEAVLLIQTMERARQGRLRAKFMKEIRQQEERERLAQQRGNNLICPLHCHNEAAELDTCLFTSCGLAWSITSGPVSTLHLIMRPVFVLS